MSTSPDPILEVRGLKTWFNTERGWARAVDGVSFSVQPGEIVGLVGESGSGKSVTALSILRLIPDPPGKIVEGSILFRGRDLVKLNWEELRAIRGNEIAMVFQEPMTSLNPVMTVGDQVAEAILAHQAISKREALDRAVEALERTGIPAASSRMAAFPHQFSGGMRQRVMIAMALACNPALLIADEPTTALDVTIQKEILAVLQAAMEKRKEASILLITHNLAVVAQTCHRVVVMYGGKIQEIAPVREIFESPLHPYTRGLVASLPVIAGHKAPRMKAIPGNVPGIFDLPAGCKFETRCGERVEQCGLVEPELVEVSPGHWVRCHLVGSSGNGVK